LIGINITKTKDPLLNLEADLLNTVISESN